MFKFKKEIEFIKQNYSDKEYIQLHEPTFNGNEKKYLKDCIDSSYVSSSGYYIDMFEKKLSERIGVNYVTAVVNGTSALQLALKVIGVKPQDEVLTQALSFIATSNAIMYNGAFPVFLDVDIDTMGLSPKAVDSFLSKNAELKGGSCFNKHTKRKITCCLPMHTFGFPLRIKELKNVCDKWKIPIIEDSAEALGSVSNKRQVGSFGKISVFSFNGNKIITAGGGGAIVTDYEELGKESKFLSTTAKRPHEYEYIHDEVGYNFRMPNLKAALACAQIEQLDVFLERKRELMLRYKEYFESQNINFKSPIENTSSNNWLNCIELKDINERNLFLNECQKKNVLCRPIWQLINKNIPYKKFQTDSLTNSKYLEERIINLPSSVV